MPYIHPTRCPKCESMSQNPDTCDVCGALISLIYKRARDAERLAEEQKLQQNAQPMTMESGSLTRKMVMAIVVVVGAMALWFAVTKKSGMAADGVAYSVTESTFDSEVLNHSTGPVLVDFYATWCGPCKMMAPELEDFASRNAGKIKVVKVDIDSNSGLAERFRVQAVPTLILMENGEEVRREMGAHTAQRLESVFKSYI